jgi:GNAT superfamily N-acetyltransferase
MHGNEIWERFLLFFVYAKKRPKIPVVRNVEWYKVQLWTLIQIACAVGIFAIAQFASVGYLYPLLLTCLVPIRSYILFNLFAEGDLKYLDPAEETEEEFHEEQRLLHHAFHDDASVDGEDLAFPTRAEFRGQGLKRALMNHNRRHSIGHGAADDILNVEVTKAIIDIELEGKSQNAAKPMEVITTMGIQRTDPKLRAATSITHLKEHET